MKKIVVMILALALLVSGCFALVACNKDAKETIVVYTNAFFAPFEYYEGTEIVGVDIDIMAKVGEKTGKNIEFKDVEFATIIDSVSDGKLCDCGAAGITITNARKEKVNFSIPYYTSVQYVIFSGDTVATSKNSENEDVVLWSQLAGKEIGVQLDTTGDIYVGIEIEGDGDYVGELNGSGAEKTQYKTAQLAVEALATTLDVVVVDEMPAKYLVKNNDYKCYPLYYDADTATEEEYAIAVNKGQTELLTAIDEVLAEMLVKDTDGNSEIDKLVAKHFGIN